jgi:type IV pilus assembly protein PilV
MQTDRYALTTESGFSMIEVLVTMLIISLALLGSAGLQAYALKTNLGGQFRNQAAFFVADIVERMEANKAQAVAGGYALAAGTAIPAPSTACDTAACSPANLAQYDLGNWQAALASGVPSGTGVITQTIAGNPSTYTIAVNWVDRKTDTTYATSAVAEPFSITTTKTIRN